MTKQQIIDKLREKFFVKECNADNFLINNYTKCVGAIKFKDDFPHVIVDDEFKTLQTEIDSLELEEKEIKFDKDELF